MRILAFALLLLGGCVFAWGLRYKLSLYDTPHSVSQRVPEAKLLTVQERSGTAVVGPQRVPDLPTPSALVLVFFVMLGARVWSKRMPKKGAWCPGAGCARSAPLAVRPPPIA